MPQWKENQGWASASSPASDIAASGRKDHRAVLLSKIESGTVRVGIIGLGYVGLPLARAFADRGIAVLGFDVDPVKVVRARSGGKATSDIFPTRSYARCVATLRGDLCVRAAR